MPEAICPAMWIKLPILSFRISFFSISYAIGKWNLNFEKDLRKSVVVLRRWRKGGNVGVLRGPESVDFEELIQVAVLEVFEDEAKRFLRRADGQDSAQIRVVQGGQESHLLVKSGLVFLGRVWQVLGSHEPL